MEFIEVFTIGIMGIIGSIIITQLFQLNWFKKENFKIQKSNVMAENRIKLKKLEREMGLPPTRKTQTEPTGNILDALKNLDMDKIQGILEALGINEDETEGSPTDTLIKMITENPEIVGKFLGGIKEKNTGNTGDTYL